MKPPSGWLAGALLLLSIGCQPNRPLYVDITSTPVSRQSSVAVNEPARPTGTPLPTATLPHDPFMYHTCPLRGSSYQRPGMIHEWVVGKPDVIEARLFGQNGQFDEMAGATQML